MTCSQCGDPLSVGAWPFCRGAGSHGTGASTVESVTWPGGKTFENLGNEPVTFYSRSEYRHYLKAHNLEECVRHVPVPGSDKSPHTSSWAGIDAQTLKNAEALVARTTTQTPEASWIASMTVTVTEEAGFVTERIEGVHAS